MASNHPDHSKNLDTFEQWFKSMHKIVHEKPVKSILQSIDDFFRHPFPRPSFHVDLEETEKEYVVKAALPGVKKDQISIEIADNALRISVREVNKVTESNDLTRIHRQMSSLQQFSRSIPFAYPVNEKKIKASYQDGLLEVHIPKKQGRKIDISIENE